MLADFISRHDVNALCDLSPTVCALMWFDRRGLVEQLERGLLPSALSDTANHLLVTLDDLLFAEEATQKGRASSQRLLLSEAPPPTADTRTATTQIPHHEQQATTEGGIIDGSRLSTGSLDLGVIDPHFREKAESAARQHLPTLAANATVSWGNETTRRTLAALVTQAGVVDAALPAMGDALTKLLAACGLSGVDGLQMASKRTTTVAAAGFQAAQSLADVFPDEPQWKRIASLPPMAAVRGYAEACVATYAMSPDFGGALAFATKAIRLLVPILAAAEAVQEAFDRTLRGSGESGSPGATGMPWVGNAATTAPLIALVDWLVLPAARVPYPGVCTATGVDVFRESLWTLQRLQGSCLRRAGFWATVADLRQRQALVSEDVISSLLTRSGCGVVAEGGVSLTSDHRPLADADRSSVDLGGTAVSFLPIDWAQLDIVVACTASTLHQCENDEDEDRGAAAGGGGAGKTASAADSSTAAGDPLRITASAPGGLRRTDQAVADSQLVHLLGALAQLHLVWQPPPDSGDDHHGSLGGGGSARAADDDGDLWMRDPYAPHSPYRCTLALEALTNVARGWSGRPGSAGSVGPIKEPRIHSPTHPSVTAALCGPTAFHAVSLAMMTVCHAARTFMPDAKATLSQLLALVQSAVSRPPTTSTPSSAPGVGALASGAGTVPNRRRASQTQKQQPSQSKKITTQDDEGVSSSKRQEGRGGGGDHGNGQTRGGAGGQGGAGANRAMSRRSKAPVWMVKTDEMSASERALTLACEVITEFVSAIEGREEILARQFGEREVDSPGAARSQYVPFPDPRPSLDAIAALLLLPAATVTPTSRFAPGVVTGRIVPAASYAHRLLPTSVQEVALRGSARWLEATQAATDLLSLRARTFTDRTRVDLIKARVLPDALQTRPSAATPLHRRIAVGNDAGKLSSPPQGLLSTADGGSYYCDVTQKPIKLPTGDRAAAFLLRKGPPRSDEDAARRSNTSSKQAVDGDGRGTEKLYPTDVAFHACDACHSFNVFRPELAQRVLPHSGNIDGQAEPTVAAHAKPSSGLELNPAVSRCCPAALLSPRGITPGSVCIWLLPTFVAESDTVIRASVAATIERSALLRREAARALRKASSSSAKPSRRTESMLDDDDDSAALDEAYREKCGNIIEQTKAGAGGGLPLHALSGTPVACVLVEAVQALPCGAGQVATVRIVAHEEDAAALLKFQSRLGVEDGEIARFSSSGAVVHGGPAAAAPALSVGDPVAYKIFTCVDVTQLSPYEAPHMRDAAQSIAAAAQQTLRLVPHHAFATYAQPSATLFRSSWHFSPWECEAGHLLRCREMFAYLQPAMTATDQRVPVGGCADHQVPETRDEGTTAAVPVEKEAEAIVLPPTAERDHQYHGYVENRTCPHCRRTVLVGDEAAGDSFHQLPQSQRMQARMPSTTLLRSLGDGYATLPHRRCVVTGAFVHEQCAPFMTSAAAQRTVLLDPVLDRETLKAMKTVADVNDKWYGDLNERYDQSDYNSTDSVTAATVAARVSPAMTTTTTTATVTKSTAVAAKQSHHSDALVATAAPPKSADVPLFPLPERCRASSGCHDVWTDPTVVGELFRHYDVHQRGYLTDAQLIALFSALDRGSGVADGRGALVACKQRYRRCFSDGKITEDELSLLLCFLARR